MGISNDKSNVQNDFNINGVLYVVGRVVGGSLDIGLIGSLIDPNVDVTGNIEKESYRLSGKKANFSNAFLGLGKGLVVSALRTVTTAGFYMIALPTAAVTDVTGYGIKKLFNRDDNGRDWQAVNYVYHEFGQKNAISITPKQKARAARNCPDI